MTCKDCVHYDVCHRKEICNDIDSWISKFGCDDFKDKNKFIEFPCKVGDTVYFINTLPHISLRMNEIYEAEVTRIVIINSGTALVIRIRDEWGTTEIPDVNKWGKTVFLAKEEAEEKLKELSK